MTNLNNRLAKLEAKADPPRTQQIYVLMYGDDGRVTAGSRELIGMTRDQVNDYLGEDVITRRVGVDISQI